MIEIIIPMIIEEKILIQYGASIGNYMKGEFVFHEGEAPFWYYQILSGEVQLCNFNESGKVHLQGIFSSGRSFGEPPLIGGFPYPASAKVTEDLEVYKLPKDAFFNLLIENPSVHLKITQALSKRIQFKAKVSSEISMNPPEDRIMTLLLHLKHEVYRLTEPFSYHVELTRQEIADLTGLRVETVIRSVKSLEKEGKLMIESRKILI